jgi:hypothetical protein
MLIEDIALILHRWPQHSIPAHTAIARYHEVAAQHRIAVLISLRESMPCCITIDDRPCGRGATVACVTPHSDGTWLFLPICDRCAQEIAIIEESSH